MVPATYLPFPKSRKCINVQSPFHPIGLRVQQLFYTHPFTVQYIVMNWAQSYPPFWYISDNVEGVYSIRTYLLRNAIIELLACAVIFWAHDMKKIQMVELWTSCGSHRCVPRNLVDNNMYNRHVYTIYNGSKPYSFASETESTLLNKLIILLHYYYCYHYYLWK